MVTDVSTPIPSSLRIPTGPFIARTPYLVRDAISSSHVAGYCLLPGVVRCKVLEMPRLRSHATVLGRLHREIGATDYRNPGRVVGARFLQRRCACVDSVVDSVVDIRGHTGNRLYIRELSN
jgi:hypothetical protein